MTSRQLSKELGGVETQVVLQSFADRILVLVTQLGKVGNLIQVSLPPTIPLLPPPPGSALPEPSPAIQLTPLLGHASSENLQTLHSLYASQIATLVWTAEAATMSRRSVVVGIALKKTSYENLSDTARDLFNDIMTMVQELAGSSL